MQPGTRKLGVHGRRHRPAYDLASVQVQHSLKLAGKEGRSFLDIDVAAQLLVPGLKLADALLLGCQRFADAEATCRLFVDLGQRRAAVPPSLMARQTSLTLKPWSRTICTTCSLKSALNVRLCFLLMLLVQVEPTDRGVRRNETRTQALGGSR